MRCRFLLACGMAMPLIYFVTLALSDVLNAGFSLIRQAPSALGQADARFPAIYNSGLMITAGTGLLGAVGLIGSRQAGAVWDGAAGVSIGLASAGLAMAGLFPLPSPLHYGFGLSTAAVLTPCLGALSLWQSGDRRAAGLLGLVFILIVGLAAAGAPPLAAGALMFASIAFLCWNVRRGMPARGGA